LSRPATDQRVVFHHNLYWNAAGPVDFNGLDLETWQKLPGGKGEGSIVADPRFVDPTAGDFRLKPDSPAAKVGFKPFDYTKAGVYGDAEWLKLANDKHFPPVEFADEPPPLPPLTLRDDFELTPPGSEPAAAAGVYHGGKGNVAFARVTKSVGAGGSERCLQFQDAPNLDHFYNPHFFYAPGHTAGVTCVAFDFQIRENSVWFMEWRDRSQPYRVGPHLSVREAKLHVPGMKPLDVPAGKWIHVEMTAGLGKDSTGTWDLTVTTADNAPTERKGIKLRHAEFKALHWLGFCSTADHETVFYLDNLELTNTSVDK